MSVTGAGYVPDLPVDYIEGLPETGRWRERRITHWHLVREEQPLIVNGRPNEARFNTGRIRGLAARMGTEVAHNPRHALLWLAEQYVKALADVTDPARVAAQRGYGTEDAWRFSLRCLWETLDGGSLMTPAGGGMEIRPGLSLDVHCYPMTVERCRLHQVQG
jgi:hypothetical protein